MKKKIIAFTVALTITFAIKAQNFSGHYILQSKEIINGKEYFNAIANDIDVSQNNDSIRIVRITPTSRDQNTNSIESLPISGMQVVTTTSSQRKKVSFISFDKEKNTATIVSTFSYANKPEDVEFKNTEIWKMNTDGTLIITKISDATVTDDWTIKGVFRKIKP